MNPQPHFTGSAYFLALFLFLSHAANSLAADNPLIGTWRWDNTRTLREFVSTKDGPQSLMKSADKAERFVEAANKTLGSNVQFTYTEHDCLEIIFDRQGNELSRDSSPYRVVEAGPGFVVIDQMNTDGIGKIFFQGDSFYVEVKVDDFTYKDYFKRI